MWGVCNSTLWNTDWGRGLIMFPGDNIVKLNKIIKDVASVRRWLIAIFILLLLQWL